LKTSLPYLLPLIPFYARMFRKIPKSAVTAPHLQVSN